MSILDDAIREHLELKRAHGADEAELKKLEDEAFGPPGRPDEQVDPFAEAPTEFLGAAATDVAEAPPEGGRRAPNIADLQEPPSFPIEDLSEEPAGEAVAEAPAEAPEAQAPPEAAAPAPEAPAEEEHPAMEHEAIPSAPAEEPAPAEQPEAAAPEAAEAPAPPAEPIDSGPSTEEREIIADQPTQFFDVEAELQAEPLAPEEPPAAEQASPTDEELLDSQLEEPRLAPASEEAELPSEELEVADEAVSEEYDEDDFFSEQRLSDELNQALEAPLTEEHEALPEHEPFREPEPPAAAAVEEDTPPPPPRAEEPTAVYNFEEAEDAEDEEPDSEEHDAFEPDTGHEDILEDTPQFLEESPDDDDLWFEQRPPKDFDFDD